MDAGLGSVKLTDLDGGDVVFRLSITGDRIMLIFQKEDHEDVSIHLEDELDVSELISLLESYFDYC